MAATTSIIKGRIGALKGSTADDITFQYNPKDMRRSRRATYARNNAARADFPNSSLNQGQSLEWIRNESEDLEFELLLHVDGDKDIDSQLEKFDALMKPDATTGEPRDLIIQFGPRADRCRILDKTVVETLFSPKLNVQEARVSLKVTLLTSRSAGGG